ncbi:MAG: hypothetical protein JNJ73_02035 [Hyphomonadaceae bacterium]|nr:hypothetical protein [Hyphomonadaceae bacterium]
MSEHPIITGMRRAMPTGPWVISVVDKRSRELVLARSFGPSSWKAAQKFVRRYEALGFGIATWIDSNSDDEARAKLGEPTDRRYTVDLVKVAGPVKAEVVQ